MLHTKEKCGQKRTVPLLQGQVHQRLLNINGWDPSATQQKRTQQAKLAA